MAIVGVSNYDSQNMVTERITRNISTIYNGLTTPNAKNITNFEVFNKYSKVVLTIARINPQKNPALFVEIARLMPKYGFVWIGNQHEVTEFGELPANCHFLGNIVNAGAYCSKADLFMLPSNYEGLPMVIIEAMSFGKPVVASNVGGISEIVRNGINGYVVENSAEAFAARIREILEDSAKERAFGRASLDIYNAELTVDRMVDSYLNIYRSLLEHYNDRHPTTHPDPTQRTWPTLQAERTYAPQLGDHIPPGNTSGRSSNSMGRHRAPNARGCHHRGADARQGDKTTVGSRGRAD